MIYLLLGGACAFLGLHTGLGSSTLLRPLLDAVSPLSPVSVSVLCTAATLSAALAAAFFALREPLPLHQDELLLLAVGAALGGVLGDVIAARFLSMIPAAGVSLLQNALLFTLVALPAVYFSTLSRTIQPLAITRVASLPLALLIALLGSFLSFGAQPLTLMLYFLLFDAENDEAAAAALTVTLCSMGGKLISLLIRMRMNLPDANVLLWLLPGAIGGALIAMIPGLQAGGQKRGETLLRLSLYTAAINIAAALA